MTMIVWRIETVVNPIFSIERKEKNIRPYEFNLFMIHDTRSVSDAFTGNKRGNDVTSSSVVIKISHTRKANAATAIREKVITTFIE